MNFFEIVLGVAIGSSGIGRVLLMVLGLVVIAGAYGCVFGG